jgi:hypothetical protein
VVPKRESDRRTRVPRFVDRVIQRRRAEAGAETPAGERPPDAATAPAPTAPADEPQADYESRLAAVERRLDHLEALLEGLQDAVHRQTVRQEREIGELERKTDAAEMTRSLDRHARERGL